MELEEFFKSDRRWNSSHDDGHDEDSDSLPDEDGYFDSGLKEISKRLGSEQSTSAAAPRTRTVPPKPLARVLQRTQTQLNRKILIRGISEIHLKDGDEKIQPKKFRQITHLHLQSKTIDKMPSFREFRNLTVLYMYDNRITEITGLENLHNLEVLDLHENNIGHISGLQGCMNLQKLYLGHNCITMIEGLEELHRLQELHIEYQKLAAAQSIVFDPASMETLSQSLKVLDLSGDKMEAIEETAGLLFLSVLIAKDNLVRELDQTALILTTLPSITKLDFRGNPIANVPKYREKLIAYSNQIENLDGKDIPPITRDSIQRFWRMKACHLKRAVEHSYEQKCTAEGDCGQENQELEPVGQPHCGSTPNTPNVNEIQADLANSKAARRQPRPLGPRYRLARPKRTTSPLEIATSVNILSSHEFPSDGGSGSDTIVSRPRSPSGTYSANSRSRGSRPDSASSLHSASALTRNASSHSPLGTQKPQFMLTTPSFLPRYNSRYMAERLAQMGNNIIHGAGNRKWMSVLSPIPAGETEEEGDDEGDADADAGALTLPARPGSPAPNINDASELTESVSIDGSDVVSAAGELENQNSSTHGPKSKACPAFAQNIYHLAPWPHIRHLGTRQPVIRFIP